MSHFMLPNSVPETTHYQIPFSYKKKSWVFHCIAIDTRKLQYTRRRRHARHFSEQPERTDSLGARREKPPVPGKEIAQQSSLPSLAGASQGASKTHASQMCLAPGRPYDESLSAENTFTRADVQTGF